DFEKAKLIVREMTDFLVLDLVDKKLVTDQIVLTVGYDIENLTDPKISSRYKGEITIDPYGRKIPKHAHGTINLGSYTSSTKQILNAVSELYDRIVDPDLLVRRIYVVANRVLSEDAVKKTSQEVEQLSMFDEIDYAKLQQAQIEEQKSLEREKKIQRTIIDIKKKYGKNAILKGMNFEEGATGKDRNRQIGGHKA
ncbi:MAG: DNA methylase, partial [Clostridia bacterium]|nr:DNA methylase [Clostridia bacterium]